MVEVGLRDGLQSVRQPLATSAKLRIVDLLLEAGCRTIEAVSFAHPRVLPQFADAEDVMRRVPRAPGIVYRALVPNVTGAQRALDADVDQLVALTCVDEKISELNQRRSVAQVLDGLAEICARAESAGKPVIAAVAMSFFAYGTGVTPFSRLEALVDQIHRLGVHEFYVADSAGMADPAQVHRTVSALARAYPDCRIGVHLHTRAGLALANTFAAMLAGAAWAESAFCGLGGDLWFPGDPGVLGNTPTEDLIAMCDYMGVSTGIDPQRFRAVVDFVEQATGRQSIAHVVRGGTRTELSHVDWETLPA